MAMVGLRVAWKSPSGDAQEGEVVDTYVADGVYTLVIVWNKRLICLPATEVDEVKMPVMTLVEGKD